MTLVAGSGRSTTVVLEIKFQAERAVVPRPGNRSPATGGTDGECGDRLMKAERAVPVRVQIHGRVPDAMRELAAAQDRLAERLSEHLPPS
jgi:hypothetical protein